MLAKAVNAKAVVDALLWGGFLSGGGFGDFFGPDDRERGASLDIEPVTPPGA
ncbi:hypothetical protein [Methylorubrum extorquens]|uniref:hypothetical protein n=1 Tax=Methylorubrum extorquens TaxID=408 RepID=UPI0012DB2554|nr:hypothetical protein [Methylorubrum extorquens]